MDLSKIKVGDQIDFEWSGLSNAVPAEVFENDFGNLYIIVAGLHCYLTHNFRITKHYSRQTPRQVTVTLPTKPILAEADRDDNSVAYIDPRDDGKYLLHLSTILPGEYNETINSITRVFSKDKLRHLALAILYYYTEDE